ncbi:alpha-D-ribose 1-methylphosphonate 5-triphosphate diphosphatase [Noviherbaspirillum sp.]|uniref:alpha-D-ribose 1-methylphosphonate 5-triphosphate diphosphatase n=1 Tax=Noviherbaspirillum sp. TaxID=1926288 RepID=UPI002FE314CB
MRLLIHGATSLLPPSTGFKEWDKVDIGLSDAFIDFVRSPSELCMDSDGTVLDGTGLIVLPGIVDLHGDAFERQIQPRPETVFSHDIALADTDRQLVANGITTACHGVTFSWEGGLRGREAALAMLRQVVHRHKNFHADHRVHLRFENHHVDGLDDALDWIAQGWIAFVAFNDHLPSIMRKAKKPEKLSAYAERARCDATTFVERMQAAHARSAEVEGVVRRLAAACRQRGIPMASHDDETRADRERYHALEATVSEFPRSSEALAAARDFGSRIVMGAPNVLLGGSHCGSLSATETVRTGMCDILTSDYYYPSLLHAPFRLAYKEDACSLADAWKLVSQHPAETLGLRDRGRIAQGYRADLLLVEAQPGGDVRLVATIAAGKLAYCAEPHRLTTNRLVPLAA